MSSARRLGRTPVRIHPGETKFKRSTPSTNRAQNQSSMWPVVRRFTPTNNSGGSSGTPTSSTRSATESESTVTKCPHIKSVKNTSPPSPDCVANAPDDDSSTETSVDKKKSSGEPSPKLKSTPIGTPARPIASKVPRLKVVLDMDECLIHSIFSEGIQPGRMPFARPNAPPPSPPPQQVTTQPLESFPLLMLDKASCIVNKRPRIDWFLEQVASRFETYVMTAGTRDYAEPLLDKLDPKKLLKGRFYRDSCVFHDGHYFKDLNLVDQDPRRVVLVDNNPASFVLCPANGIPVTSFYDDPYDRALEGALEVLISLEKEADVRKPLRQMYNLETKLAPMVRHFQRRM